MTAQVLTDREKRARRNAWMYIGVTYSLCALAVAFVYLDNKYATDFGMVNCRVATVEALEQEYADGRLDRRVHSVSLQCGEHIFSSDKGPDSLGFSAADHARLRGGRNVICTLTRTSLTIGYNVKNCKTS